MLFYNPERPERRWGPFSLSPLFNGIWGFSNEGEAAEACRSSAQGRILTEPPKCKAVPVNTMKMDSLTLCSSSDTTVVTRRKKMGDWEIIQKLNWENA